MHLIGRRNFLAGLGLGAGAHLLAPMFRQMLPEALGQARRKAKRLIILSSGNGFLEASYTAPRRSETDFDLPPSLEPLAPFKDQMVFLSKFYNPFSNLHGNGYSLLSVSKVHEVLRNPKNCCGESWSMGSITIDVQISKAAPFNTAPFPFTAVGPSWAGQPIVPSGEGPNNVFPAERSPLRAYEKYFGAATAGVPADKLLAEEKSVLDFMRADVARMSQRVGAAERARLDQYTESLRALERQLGSLVAGQATCAKPTKPALGYTTNHADYVDLKQIDAYGEIITAAQICGLTHVSHIGLWTVDGPQIGFPSSFGLPTNLHDTHHLTEKQSDAGVLHAGLLAVDRFLMGRVALVASRLAAVPEEGGTMLDNSVVLYVNGGGGRHHNGQNRHCAIMLGKAGGQLRTGRNLEYPKMAHAMSDFYVSLGNLFGLDITTFGDKTICKGPLPGLV